MNYVNVNVNVNVIVVTNGYEIRYLKLEKEKKARDGKWTHEEDIQLLRGYQVYGEKWSLVSLFFLPHRQRKELRQRLV